MKRIEWAMWANEQAIASAATVVLGGIIGIAGMFKWWQFGIYALVVGTLIFLFEYPRGKRETGKTVERRFQKPMTMAVNTCGLIGRNYFVRFVLYLILGIPCCFILPTVLGGVCLFITSAIYFVAALKGEEWQPVGLDASNKKEAKRVKSLHPPRKPPPRRPPQADANPTFDDITADQGL